MSISNASLLSDVILFIKNRLLANITDPISSTRNAAQKFVMTSYPKRDVTYPIITVRGRIDNSQKLGQQSEKSLVTLSIEVRIWARNEKEKNNLQDEVFEDLRTNQYPTSTSNTSTNLELFDFSLNFATDLDEPGEQGVKSKLQEYQYIYLTE